MFKHLMTETTKAVEKVNEEELSRYPEESGEVVETLFAAELLNSTLDKILFTQMVVETVNSENRSPSQVERMLIQNNLNDITNVFGRCDSLGVALECDFSAFNSIALEGLGDMLKKAYEAVKAFLKRIWNFFFGKKDKAKELEAVSKQVDKDINNCFRSLAALQQKQQKEFAEILSSGKTGKVFDEIDKLLDEEIAKKQRSSDLDDALKSLSENKGEVIEFPSSAKGVSKVTVPVASKKPLTITVDASVYQIGPLPPKDLNGLLHDFNVAVQNSSKVKELLASRLDLIEDLLEVDLTKDLKLGAFRQMAVDLTQMSKVNTPPLNFPGGKILVVSNDGNEVDRSKLEDKPFAYLVSVMGQFKKGGVSVQHTNIPKKDLVLEVGAKEPKLEKLPKMEDLTKRAGELAKLAEKVAERNKGVVSSDGMQKSALAMQTTLITDISQILNFLEQLKTSYQKLGILFSEVRVKHSKVAGTISHFQKIQARRNKDDK